MNNTDLIHKDSSKFYKKEGINHGTREGMMATIRNKKLRGRIARTEIERKFQSENNELLTASDVKIAKKFNISRLTVINIRKELSIKPRNDRIVDLLKRIDTSALTLKELSTSTGIKYQNLYKIVRSLNITTKPDIRPIEKMIRYHQVRRCQLTNVH